MSEKLKKYPWRVQVKRVVEQTVEIVAENSQVAECMAANLPGVTQVLVGMTIRGDKRVGDPLAGIEDDNE